MKKTITLKTAKDIRTPAQDIDSKLDAWVNETGTQEMARLHMNIKKDLHRALKRLCADKDMSITTYVVDLIEQDMRNKQNG